MPHMETPIIQQDQPAQRGIVLGAVLIFSLIAAIFAAGILSALSDHSRMVEDDALFARALYLAECGLNRSAEAVWVGYLNCNPLPSSRISWLENHYRDFDQIDAPIGDQGDSYTVRARRIMLTGEDDERYLVFEATGKAAGGPQEFVERTLTRVIRYGHDQSSIFDYTYFINNFGWFWGSSIYANGDVRANGNFSLKSNPTVNGDIYSSINPDIGAPGAIIDGGFKNWNLSTYRQNFQSNWRPTKPPFEYGYDGTVETFEFQQPLEMPYLSDINRFIDLAIRKNGTLTTSTTNITHSTNGPIFLLGTPDNPIVIDGPVVIRGDVVIGGYVTGQGTIYAERNVHVIGDLIYKKPPVYDKSETADPAANSAYNSTADFLGLAAKGNIILGNYTNSTDWYNKVSPYMKPTFTKPYTDEDGSRHNGDYTAVDGKKLDNTNRKRYESTFSNTQFQNYVNQTLTALGMPDHRIRRMDALAYTNHLYAGRTNNGKFNGAIMSRDEAVVFDGSVYMNYDYRAKAEGEYYIDIDLPKAANASPVVWLEGSYEDWIEKMDALDAGL